jgi:NAD(P)-dependent dehydrogenase (short-subunit alcohol dehydrogenase family)
MVGIDKHPGAGNAQHDMLVVDIRNAAAVQHAVTQAIDRLGGLDILINNAGVLSIEDAGALPDENVQETIAVNLLGMWHVTAAALPALLASHGRVINIASLFAVVNAPLLPAYSATKRAVAAYSDVLRMQYGDRLTVTTLYPGYMRTPIHAAAERQGLSVARLVTIYWHQHKILSLEEPLEAAAQGVLRACYGRPRRDRGVTLTGTLTLLMARHLPGLMDRCINWRMKSLMKTGALQISVQPQRCAPHIPQQ